MSGKLQPLKGMKDLLPGEQRVFNSIVNSSRKLSALYGYEEISTPIVESINVFDRTLGDTSDVVSKEMYDFMDKGDRHIALRPEFTAGVMRAVISNNLTNDLPLRLFSYGPLFRYDRPQSGRQRQFHQINFENIGVSNPYSDAEIIDLAVKILEDLQIRSDLVLEINSLGCVESRASFASALVEYFRKYESELSDDSKARLEKNPLRILDSKDERDKIIAVNAPQIDKFYTKESSEYFEQVLTHLDLLGIEYSINKRLARGLDYYCHTTFEVTTNKLGAQSTVLAGGRYNGLCKLLGGPDVPAIGFASGIERLMLMMKQEIVKPKSVVVMPITANEESEALRLATIMRASNLNTVIDAQGKIPKRMQRAVANNAKFVVFIGEEERKNDVYKIKNLDSEQENVFNLIALMKLVKEGLN